MIRKTTAAALVLSAVHAALALTLFAGTAQAEEDTPWRKSVTPGTTSSTSIAGDDTPWPHRLTAPSGDTPWR